MLFSIGLNLSFPWKVVKSEFRLLDESNIRELHIWIDFEYGSRFISSKGTLLSPHDTVDKQWRHLNFFEHPCYLHARVPRLKTDVSSIERVQVPWARHNGRSICEVICILQIACWWTVPEGWTPQIARPLGGKPEGISTQLGLFDAFRGVCDGSYRRRDTCQLCR